MSEANKPVSFCDDCPVANGVNKIPETFESAWFLDRAVAIYFQDTTSNHMSKPVIFTNNAPYVDSGMEQGAYSAALTKIAECKGPTDKPNPSFFGRLIGKTTVKACGAFPATNQNKKGVSL